MKKIWLVLMVITTIIIIADFTNRWIQWYYPPLPIDFITSKEAVQKLNESTQKLVNIGNNHTVTWFIMKHPENGTIETDKTIEQFINHYGWDFKEKAGSGLIFEKNNEQLIVSTQMWTSRYVLVKIPSYFESN